MYGAATGARDVRHLGDEVFQVGKRKLAIAEQNVYLLRPKGAQFVYSE